MALSNPPTAQQLDRRVVFAKRVEIDDGLGNVEGRFADQFSLWAAFRSRGGNEAVVAARLEGRNVLGVYLRSSPQSRQIKSDWRMTDKRTGQEYAVKIADAATDRNWVYVEVQTGSAA